MRAGLLSVCVVFVLAPTLTLVSLSAQTHAAAGQPARPNPPAIAHVVSSSRHFRPAHRSPPHRPRRHAPHRPRRHAHRPHRRQHWCPCTGSTASPLPTGWGEGACPSPTPTVTSASPSPTMASPSPRPSPSRSPSTSPFPNRTSPSPGRTTSAPSPTSPATPPTVRPPSSNRLGRHRPGRAPHAAPAAFSRVQGPAPRTRAGLSIRLLMILVLIPCAAVAVLRYASKR
jgi:hypothetical protein